MPVTMYHLMSATSTFCYYLYFVFSLFDTIKRLWAYIIARLFGIFITNLIVG